MKNDNELVRLTNLDIFYGRNIVLKNLNCSICRGEKIGIVGPNGSGKTTLIKTLMNLHKTYRGSIHVDPRMRIGYAAQRTNQDMLIPLTVKQYISLNSHTDGDSNGGHFYKWSEKMGLANLFDKLFSDLSGGQKQRAVLMRAMFSNPDCLILDEPTDNLDICSEKILLNLIDEFCREKLMALILISHSLDAVINHVDRLIILKDTRASEIFIDGANAIGESLSKIFQTEIKVESINGKWVLI